LGGAFADLAIASLQNDGDITPSPPSVTPDSRGKKSLVTFGFVNAGPGTAGSNVLALWDLRLGAEMLDCRWFVHAP
jgi:hypothetical protein